MYLFAVSFSLPHDVKTKSGLTKLYNKQVVKVQPVHRPLDGLSWKLGPLKHSGVIVTTKDGKKYLVHKGKGYGKSSQTVIGVRGGGAGGAAAPPILREIIIFGQFLLKYSGNL